MKRKIKNILGTMCVVGSLVSIGGMAYHGDEKRSHERSEAIQLDKVVSRLENNERFNTDYRVKFEDPKDTWEYGEAYQKAYDALKPAHEMALPQIKKEKAEIERHRNSTLYFTMGLGASLLFFGLPAVCGKEEY